MNSIRTIGPLILFATSFQPTFSQTAIELKNPPIIRNQMWQKLFHTKVSASSRIFNLNFLDGLSVELRGAFELNRVKEGVHARTERLQLSANLTPGTEMLNVLGERFPIGLHIRMGREIEVTRYFNSRMASIEAQPIWPWELPWTATLAKKLPENTVVSFPLSMAIGLGVGFSDLQYPILSQARTGLIWAHEFRLVVIKLSEDRVIVRIMPKVEVSWTTFASSEIRTQLFSFDANRVLRIERNVERIIGADFLRLSVSKRLFGEAKTFDIEMDLSKDSARHAYDHLFQKSFALVGVQHLEAFGKTFASDSTSHVLDMTPLLNKTESTAGLRILFGGEDQTTGLLSHWHFGLKVLRWSGQKSYLYHDVTTLYPTPDENFKLLHYLDHSRTKSWCGMLNAHDVLHSYSAISQGVDFGMRAERVVGAHVVPHEFQNLLNRFAFITGKSYLAHKEYWQTKARSRVELLYSFYLPSQNFDKLRWQINSGAIGRKDLAQLFDIVMQHRPQPFCLSSSAPFINNRDMFVDRILAIFNSYSAVDRYDRIMTRLNNGSDFQEFFFAYLRILHERIGVSMPMKLTIQVDGNNQTLLDTMESQARSEEELIKKFRTVYRISGFDHFQFIDVR